MCDDLYGLSMASGRRSDWPSRGTGLPIFTKHSQAAKQDGVQAGRQEAGQADFNSKGLAAILVEVQG